MNERSIFAAALDIADAAERVAYLDRECGNDAALRRQLDQLLVAQRELGSFLDQPPPGIDKAKAEEPITEKPGAEIGPYKLLEQMAKAEWASSSTRTSCGPCAAASRSRSSSPAWIANK